MSNYLGSKYLAVFWLMKKTELCLPSGDIKSSITNDSFANLVPKKYLSASFYFELISYLEFIKTFRQLCHAELYEFYYTYVTLSLTHIHTDSPSTYLFTFIEKSDLKRHSTSI